MKKLIILTALCTVIAGCSGAAPTANNANGAGSPNAPAAANSAKLAAPANSPSAAADKPAANSGPTRVSFSKGATSSSQSITLAPGATLQFVLGATGAQTLFVEPGSKELTFKMLKGIGGEFVQADDGSYSAETKGNNAQRGDILFEVKNPSSKEIKTTLKISVEDFGD